MPRRTIVILLSLLFNLPQAGNLSGAAFAEDRLLRRLDRDVTRDVHRDLNRDLSTPNTYQNYGNYRQAGTQTGGQFNSTVPPARTQESIANPNVNTQGQMTSPNLGSKMDSMSDMSQTEQMRLQNAMDQKAKLEQTMSNIMKSNSDTQNAIINNMK